MKDDSRLSVIDRRQLYRSGWQRGAAGSAKHPDREGYDDFERGYRDGSAAAAKALHEECERKGWPVPSERDLLR